MILSGPAVISKWAGAFGVKFDVGAVAALALSEALAAITIAVVFIMNSLLYMMTKVSRRAWHSAPSYVLEVAKLAV